jgi:hypothetical protein
MTETDRKATMNRATQPGSWRVQKVGKWWFVTDLENPSQFVPFISFTKKKDAVEFANRNASALFKRYRDEDSAI